MTIYDRDPNFEARITILTEAEGGRRTPPLQGIRWDFRYATDQAGDPIYMIHPQFLADDGTALPERFPLHGTLYARMFIVIPEMVPYHLERLAVGTKFFCVEGAHACAKGEVTKIFDHLDTADQPPSGF